MPTRSATKTKATPARARLLDAAEDLFSAHGIQAVGIEAILERAGVAKMTLYHHFDSKEDLVQAWLERRHDAWRTWITAEVQRLSPDPKGRVLAFFDALEEWCSSPQFSGCPFINTALEIRRGTTPNRGVCDKHFAFLGQFLLELVAQAHVPNPVETARQLSVLAQGAIVACALSGKPEFVSVAKAGAGKILGI